jgi:hypothetical protein
MFADAAIQCVPIFFLLLAAVYKLTIGVPNQKKVEGVRHDPRAEPAY